MSTTSMDQGDWNPPLQEASAAPSQSTDEDDGDESTVYVESHKVTLQMLILLCETAWQRSTELASACIYSADVAIRGVTGHHWV